MLDGHFIGIGVVDEKWEKSSKLNAENWAEGSEEVRDMESWVKRNCLGVLWLIEGWKKLRYLVASAMGDGLLHQVFRVVPGMKAAGCSLELSEEQAWGKGTWNDQVPSFAPMMDLNPVAGRWLGFWVPHPNPAPTRTLL